MEVNITLSTANPKDLKALETLIKALQDETTTATTSDSIATPAVKPPKTQSKATKPTVEETPKPTTVEATKPTAEPKKEAEAEPEAVHYDIENIRTMLVDLKLDKGIEEVRAILKKHGATTGKLAEVHPSKYPEMAKEIKAAIGG